MRKHKSLMGRLAFYGFDFTTCGLRLSSWHRTNLWKSVTCKNCLKTKPR